MDTSLPTQKSRWLTWTYCGGYRPWSHRRQPWSNQCVTRADAFVAVIMLCVVLSFPLPSPFKKLRVAEATYQLRNWAPAQIAQELYKELRLHLKSLLSENRNLSRLSVSQVSFLTKNPIGNQHSLGLPCGSCWEREHALLPAHQYHGRQRNRWSGYGPCVWHVCCIVSFVFLSETGKWRLWLSVSSKTSNIF